MNESRTNSGRGALETKWGEVEEEHRRLRNLFARVETAENRAEALVAVSELQRRLHAHFLQEEQRDGLFATLGLKTEGVRELLADHGKLRRLLIETRDLMESYDELSPERIAAACTRLKESLRSHEDEERAFVRAQLAGP